MSGSNAIRKGTRPPRDKDPKLDEIVSRWEKIYEMEHEVMDLGENYMNGECCSIFNHKNPKVQEFRRALPIYCGDWYLYVFVIERGDVEFERFVGNCERYDLINRFGESYLGDQAGDRFVLSKVRELDEHFLNGYRCGYWWFPDGTDIDPAKVFWDMTNFKTILYDWNRMTARSLPDGEKRPFQQVYGKAPDGKEFLPRVFVDLAPEGTGDDVHKIWKEALDGLERLPDLEGGLPRDKFVQFIHITMDKLRILIEEHGTFAEAVISDAYAPLTDSLTKQYDGNFRDTYLATERYYFRIHFSTS